MKSRFLARAAMFAAFMAVVGCSGSPAQIPADASIPDYDGRVIADPEDEIAFIYDQDQFLTFEIRLSEENLAILDADPVAEEYVLGTLVFDGVEYGPVGIRYKGSYGAWVNCTEAEFPNVGGAKTCPKLNLKVSFNWVDPEARFFGVKKLLFHAMNMDPSMMRERMGYLLFRKLGVPSPRAVHVKLLINGVLSGVYLNVEYIDGRFTRSRFDNGEGNLYKEVWPTYGANQVQTTADRLLAALRTNEDENPSVERVLAFGDAVMDHDGVARTEVIRTWMSIVNTMRYVAVDRTIRADDGPFHFYCGTRCDNHNYYLYQEEQIDRLWLIPWDLDNAFVVVRGSELSADSYVKIIDEWDDHSVVCQPRAGAAIGAPRQLPPSCDPLIKGWAAFGEEYRTAVAELLDGPFSVATVDAMIASWATQIAATTAEAHAADQEQLSSEEWQEGCADFRERTEILRARAAAQL